MNFLKPKLPTIQPPASLPRPVRCQSILHIQPNLRGGLSLRWDGDDEEYGNYATVADASRAAEFQFADLVLVSSRLERSAQCQLATA